MFFFFFSLSRFFWLLVKGLFCSLIASLPGAGATNSRRTGLVSSWIILVVLSDCDAVGAQLKSWYRSQ